MLRVTVELWPGGVRLEARVIASAEIANVSDLAQVSDYVVRATEGYNPVTGTPPWSASGHVMQHDRSTSVWHLVSKAAAWAAEEAKDKF